MGESSKSDMGITSITKDPFQLQITIVKFNGNNYFMWSKSVLIYIQGKGKDEYLTGEVEIPPKSDPHYRKWKIENAMVMGLLLSSMKAEINENYLFLDIFYQIGNFYLGNIQRLNILLRCMSCDNELPSLNKVISFWQFTTLP